MQNQKSSIKKASNVVSFLRAVGHRRLWITRFWVGIEGEDYYYAIVGWDHRVLADWDASAHQWDIRYEAWRVEPDSRDDLPEDVLAEIVSKGQLFQLSLVESFA
jgi:hypothetical protein